MKEKSQKLEILVSVFVAISPIVGALIFTVAVVFDSWGSFAFGLGFQYVGILFLLSYYFEDILFLRVFMWICVYFTTPSSRKNAFYYFWTCLLAGGVLQMYSFGLI